MSDRIARLNRALAGRYRIERVLGRGGMAVVYLAEQLRPVRRTVALKIMAPDADSEELLERFEIERQALARMEHPSIATVFDAGVTDDGEPYFVMERVEGTSITTFCDEHRLDVRERVRLYIDVVNAVQHAHLKGVVHRDLKPSNVLIRVVDGVPRPKIIDFGIAKAATGDAFDAAELTRVDQVIGTPAYMSPEQIGGDADVDTRSDIFALGTMLYELLAGALPFDGRRYGGWSAVTLLLQEEPPTMSRRLLELQDELDSIAGRRSTTPMALRTELGGDIGWIVTRAMQKDPERRYETAHVFALDLQRYLNHEVVLARAAGRAHHLRKFARRNRAAVAVSSLFVLGLVAFGVTSSVQAARIASARDEAEARRDQAEDLIDFMLSDLRDKLEPIGRLEVLDDVGDQALRYFAAVPEEQFSDGELASRSRALYQIGSVRLDQGEHASAARAFTESLRLARSLSERAPNDTDRLFELSQSHFYVGYASWLEGDLETAEEQFLGYLSVADRLVELEPDNLDYRQELGFARSNLGSVREARGDLEGAAEAYALTLETERFLAEQDSTDIDRVGELAETHNLLGVVYRKLGRYESALEHHRRELELKRAILTVEPEHAYWRYRSARALGFLVAVMADVGRIEEAVRLRREEAAVLDSLVAYEPGNTVWRRGLAVAHRQLAVHLAVLGDLPQAEEFLDTAERELEELVRTDSTSFGWRFELAAVLAIRADLRIMEGRPTEALEAAEAASALGAGEEAGNAAQGAIAARAQRALGEALSALDRHDEARRAWTRSLEIVEAWTRDRLDTDFGPIRAELLFLLGRLDEGRQVLEKLEETGYVNGRLRRLAEAGSARE